MQILLEIKFDLEHNSSCALLIYQSLSVVLLNLEEEIVHQLDEAKREAARARFERHFGALSLDNATSLNNESIDADLAGEYANICEDD